MNNWMQMAMAGAPGGGSAGAKADPTAGFMSLLPLVLIFVLFYVLFIVPQRKQQKKHEELLKNLKKGDEVVTSGGILGTVTGVNEKENTVYIKVAENLKIEVQRSAIATLRNSPAAVEKSQPSN